MVLATVATMMVVAPAPVLIEPLRHPHDRADVIEPAQAAAHGRF
jgi:hypothetical protein